MDIELFYYDKKNGWSVDDFPKLDSENTIVFIFSAPQYLTDQAPIKELSKIYPKSTMIGCSSAGEINGALVMDKAISVAVARFEHTKVASSLIKIENAEESFSAGEKIVNALNKPGLRGIIVLSEGLLINGSELVKGLNSINNKDVIITGGLAGDSDQFKKTWIVYNGEIYLNSIVAVGLYGDKVNIGYGSRGGWDNFGVERVITRSKNNILYELDNKPALSLYKEYLGDRAEGLPATGLLFPMAIRKDRNDDKQLVRTILGVDEDEQALIFAGDMPTGYLSQLMAANFDRLIDGANQASESAIQSNTKLDANNPALTIAISCVGRKLLLGERTEEEVESILTSMPNTMLAGFYSYGELSPYKVGNCDLHNQTMTLTIINEE